MSNDDPYEPEDLSDAYDPVPDDHYELSEPVESFPESQPARPQPTGGLPSYVPVKCSQCGYNLTGVAIGTVCPECGADVQTSLYAANQAPPNGMAITSMVLGIIAVCGLCCCPTGFLGIIGLIFGIIANNQMSTGSYNNASKNMAMAGIICSSIGIVLGFVWILMLLA